MALDWKAKTALEDINVDLDVIMSLFDIGLGDMLLRYSKTDMVGTPEGSISLAKLCNDLPKMQAVFISAHDRLMDVQKQIQEIEQG